MRHPNHYSATLGEQGRMVIPAPLRHRLNLQPGDRLILVSDPNGGFRVVSAREQANRLLGLFRNLAPNRSLADELIAERRVEANRDDGR